jgi:hypothetical protein
LTFIKVQEKRHAPAFNIVSWYGFFVPVKTATEIIVKMNTELLNVSGYWFSVASLNHSLNYLLGATGGS